MVLVEVKRAADAGVGELGHDSWGVSLSTLLPSPRQSHIVAELPVGADRTGAGPAVPAHLGGNLHGGVVGHLLSANHAARGIETSVLDGSGPTGPNLLGGLSEGAVGSVVANDAVGGPQGLGSLEGGNERLGGRGHPALLERSPYPQDSCGTEGVAIGKDGRPHGRQGLPAALFVV